MADHTLRSFWSRLDGPVHPDDRPVLARIRHPFNLDYPPPAFVGDVDNAPVVMLMANGDYIPGVTPGEFPTAQSVQEYIDYIRGVRRQLPTHMSPYYLRRKYSDWIKRGQMVLVNAVAYRSPRISTNPIARWAADQLPSVQTHRQWLRSVLIPQAAAGDRLVIAHRNALWQLKRAPLPGVIFTENGRFENLSHAVIGEIGAWLEQRSAILALAN